MVRIATLNLRADANRWTERYPLVVELLHELQADVIALQEVRINIDQHLLLRDALNKFQAANNYDTHLCKDWYDPPILGNAFLTRLPIIEHEQIDLPEGYRTAHRILLEVDGKRINITNTHLHHKPYDDECIRLPQLHAIYSWLRQLPDTAVLVGDLNARPDSETIQTAKQWLTSAYEQVHRNEPEQTFPSPLRHEENLTPRTIDYILVDEQWVTIENAGLLGHHPHRDDPSLYASDHFGLWADINWK